MNLQSVVCNVLKSNDAHAFLRMNVYITLNAVKTIHTSTEQTTVPHSSNADCSTCVYTIYYI